MHASLAPFRLTPEWIAWLEDNLARRVPRTALAEAMMQDGCESTLAQGLAEAWDGGSRLTSSDASGTPPATLRFAKVRWLLETLRTLQAERPFDALAERDSLDAKEFYERFYSANTPAVYRDCLSPASLAEALDFDRLDTEFGDRNFQVTEFSSDGKKVLM